MGNIGHRFSGRMIGISGWFSPQTLHTSEEPVMEKEVPERYVKDFKKSYPNVEKASWTKVDSLVYDVDFVNQNKNEVSVRFSNKGVETRWIVNTEYTPQSIKKYVEENMSKYKIKKIYILDIRNKKTYQVEVAKKFLFWTKDEKILNFEIDGKFIDEQSKK